MQTLVQYLSDKPKRTDQEWADFFGTSRSHFTEIRRGTAQPSKKLMERICARTDGAVPIVSWFAGAD